MNRVALNLLAFVLKYKKPLTIAVAAFIVSYVDPLGIEEATGERARSTMMRLSSTLAPVAADVAVVLIDQEYVMSHNGGRWPLTYRDQGSILRQISLEEPKSVFIDLLYKNQHQLVPGLVTSVDASNDENLDLPEDLVLSIQSTVPFYFAALPRDRASKGDRDEFDLSSVPEAIQKFVARGEPVENRLGMVAWEGYGDEYPLEIPGRKTARTPAFAMYADYCTHPKIDGCEKSAGEYERPLVVRWGAFLPKDFAAGLHRKECQYTARAAYDGYLGYAHRLGALARQFGLALVDKNREAASLESRLPCPPFAVLKASDLMKVGPARNEDAIKSALHQKFVFVGADVDGIPDDYTSPVQGQVPGVMLHAMAMANLLDRGSDYIRAPPDWILIPLKLALLCGIAVYTASQTSEAGRWSRWALVTIGLAAWLGCALFCFTHGATARGMWFLFGGAVVTSIAPSNSGKAILLFVLVCAISLLMIERGWEPTNWIVLAVAAVLVRLVVEHSRPKVTNTPRPGDRAYMVWLRRITLLRGG